MDRDELIFEEYKLYCEQKENFVERNFGTNKFYMAAVLVLIFSLIYTGNVVFLNKISATFVFALLGVCISTLWWMNVDSYNTLIKVKYSNVIDKIEEKLPIKPFSEEFKGIQEFRKNRVFMFSDIQKLIAVIVALFFFAVLICEAAPYISVICAKMVSLLGKIKSGI